MAKEINRTENILPSSLNKKYRRLLLYTRISTLAMLNYYGRDGLSYLLLLSLFYLFDIPLSYLSDSQLSFFHLWS